MMFPFRSRFSASFIGFTTVHLEARDIAENRIRGWSCRTGLESIWRLGLFWFLFREKFHLSTLCQRRGRLRPGRPYFGSNGSPRSHFRSHDAGILEFLNNALLLCECECVLRFVRRWSRRVFRAYACSTQSYLSRDWWLLVGFSGIISKFGSLPRSLPEHAVRLGLKF